MTTFVIIFLDFMTSHICRKYLNMGGCPICKGKHGIMNYIANGIVIKHLNGILSCLQFIQVRDCGIGRSYVSDHLKKCAENDIRKILAEMNKGRVT